MIRPERGVAPEDKAGALVEPENWDHVRHMVAKLRALLWRSAQSSESVESLAAHLDGRMMACARVAALIWGHHTIDLETLLREEMLVQAASDEQFTISGPEVLLAPRAAEMLALVFHELATNATKFGAFCRPHAVLEISWTLRDGKVALVWKESAGLRGIGPPARRGFGFELIMQSLPYELQADVEWVLEADGVRCTMVVPLAEDRQQG